MCLAQGPQRSDAGEARTLSPINKIIEIWCHDKNLLTKELKCEKVCLHWPVNNTESENFYRGSVCLYMYVHIYYYCSVDMYDASLTLQLW